MVSHTTMLKDVSHLTSSRTVTTVTKVLQAKLLTSDTMMEVLEVLDLVPMPTLGPVWEMVFTITLEDKTTK